MNEKVINIHKYEEGNEDVIVEFGLGKIGIGLASESQRNMIVRLQELNKAKDVGAFLTAEERDDNFKNTANPLEVVLVFPDVKSIDNFIETLKIYRQKVFFPNARTRHG
ncbi:MAG: hypothetical protein SPL21_10040 [Fibrobacter sp.]|nr:hypothetical protein [Fibrobacter sp.]